MATWQVARAGDTIRLAGTPRIAEAAQLWHALRQLATLPGPRLDFNLSQLTDADATVMALLVEFRRSLVARGTACELLGTPPALQAMLRLYRGDKPAAALPPPVARRHALERFGRFAAHRADDVRESLTFIGGLIAAIAHRAGGPRRVNWRALPGLITRAGADALLIVVLLDFLLGCVIALQAKTQLEMLGANLYVADLVSISVTRELAPLVTAIIIAGRSGAAYAAELGTMRVSEEVDALTTIGISPIPHLVLPRIIALAVVSPLLALVGDVAAVLGGLIVAITSLGLTAQGFLTEVRTTLIPSDVWTGLVKSLVFGITIALVACREGLSAHGAAAGVGRRTTATVVASLFFIVLLDTMLTIYFREVNV